MVYGNEEHKQRVNLSSFAQSVLEGDRAMFGDGLSLSGFFNRIITAFYPTADASVEVALEGRRQELRAALAAQKDSEEKDALIETLVVAYRRELLAKKESYPQGASVLFRLNNRNFEWLYDDEAESENYPTPSKYLKALLEEYARLSPAERERVYFSYPTVDKIETAIDAGYGLEVRFSDAVRLVRPYAILSDEFGTHLYLVGLSRTKDDPEESERIVSLRVSRLNDIKTVKRCKKLTIDDKRAVEEKLREVGVQYLVGEAEEIVVALTPFGEATFRQIRHMRPQPMAVEEGGVYRFWCTTRQIKNYFIRFGKDAKVLSPLSLREEFLAHYEEARTHYKE